MDLYYENTHDMIAVSLIKLAPFLSVIFMPSYILACPECCEFRDCSPTSVLEVGHVSGIGQQHLSFAVTEEARAYHSSCNNDFAPKGTIEEDSCGHVPVKGKIAEANRP
jgi:hypothetical protein